MMSAFLRPRALAALILFACAASAPEAVADILLTPGSTASVGGPIDDNFEPFTPGIAGLGSGPISTLVYRDTITNVLNFRYDISSQLGLGRGDSLALSGFGSLSTLVRLGTIDNSLPQSSQPSVPNFASRSTDGGTITLSDFARTGVMVSTPLPLVFNVASSDALGYGLGEADVYLGGKLAGSYAILVPTVPEPSTLVYAGIAAVAGIGWGWRRRI